MTATLCYTSATPSTADRMAHVKAAGRRYAERQVQMRKAVRRMAEARTYAETLLADMLAGGAVKIGVKVCADDGKYRYVVPLDADREYILIMLASTYGEDAEVWGITADGTYC